jgi:hypothetical protein
MLSKSILLVALCCVVSASLTLNSKRRLTYPTKYTFPLYLQCDPRWSNNTMGNKTQWTICQDGCAMSSTAMALAGLGVTIDNKPVTPGSFNTWLIANHGYWCTEGSCDDLNLTAPEQLSTVMTLIGEKEKPPYKEIAEDLALQNIIHVAHVRNKTHFVLLLSALPKSPVQAFRVHDPAYSVTSYPYANISDIIRFKVNVYPRYMQCDPRWGDNKMGTDGDTVCKVGCLMSSISSAIAGTGIWVNNQTSTPGTLNAFLRAHDGYENGTSDLRESKIPLVAPGRISWPSDGMHTTNDIPFDTIKKYLNQQTPRIVIANVMSGRHFVLVVGYRADGDTLVVNDSGFPGNVYSYSKDVVGWRIFDMS